MINSLDLNKYIELYQDFLHPNPNINSQAFLILKKEFEVKFMNNLLANLKEEDLFIRRKSILALGRFGEKALKSIVQLYMDTNNTTVKVSCLKTIIKVVVNFNLEELTQLISSCKFVLKLSLKNGGSSINDYKSPDGTLGSFQSLFKVYQKEHVIFKKKSYKIKKIIQNGRSTFFSPALQK